MSAYLFIKWIHLTAATFFIGGVFFEMMIISHATQQLEPTTRQQFGKAFGQRAKQVMPWVILTLYSAGLILAGYYYRSVLAHPFASSFGTLLALKIVLAFSILAHFITVMVLMKQWKLTSKISRWIHRSVFIQMLGILFLAKAMFLWQ
ncbi:MAG TPA: hypothetical protein PKZ68_03225 [Pseudomonadales bacterium]|nr:hypothetical protein [Pseudomonadales bacterium]